MSIPEWGEARKEEKVGEPGGGLDEEGGEGRGGGKDVPKCRGTVPVSIA